MAQQIRALVAHPEDLGFIPSTHIVPRNHQSKGLISSSDISHHYQGVPQKDSNARGSVNDVEMNLFRDGFREQCGLYHSNRLYSGNHPL